MKKAILKLMLTSMVYDETHNDTDVFNGFRVGDDKCNVWAIVYDFENKRWAIPCHTSNKEETIRENVDKVLNAIRRKHERKVR